MVRARYPAPQFAGLFLGAAHGGGAAATAHLSSATQIGGLSEALTWAVTPADAVSKSPPQSHHRQLPRQRRRTPGNNGILQGMPMTGGARRGASGFTHKYGFKHSVLTRPPSAG